MIIKFITSGIDSGGKSYNERWTSSTAQGEQGSQGSVTRSLISVRDGLGLLRDHTWGEDAADMCLNQRKCS